MISHFNLVGPSVRYLLRLWLINIYRPVFSALPDAFSFRTQTLTHFIELIHPEQSMGEIRLYSHEEDKIN